MSIGCDILQIYEEDAKSLRRFSAVCNAEQFGRNVYFPHNLPKSGSLWKQKYDGGGSKQCQSVVHMCSRKALKIVINLMFSVIAKNLSLHGGLILMKRPSQPLPNKDK